MVAESGRPIDLTSINRRFEGQDRLIERIMRQINRTQPPAATTPVPGQRGSLEIHSTSTTLESQGLRFHTWGGVVQGEDPDGVTIGLDYHDGTPSQLFAPSDAGYYSTKVDVDVVMAKAGAPTRIRLEVNEAAGSIVYYEQMSVPGMWADFDADHYSVRFRAPSQVFYLPRWYSYPRLGVRLFWGTTGTPSIVSASCDYFLTRVA